MLSRLQIQRDEDGIALGGLRTPPVDVPVEVLSGQQGPSGDTIWIRSGSTRSMSSDRLARLYSSRHDYEQRFRRATNQAIRDGYVLEADRASIEGYAEPDLVSG